MGMRYLDVFTLADSPSPSNTALSSPTTPTSTTIWTSATVPTSGSTYVENLLASYILKPSDVGQDWSYEVDAGITTYGANPNFSQDGMGFELFIRRVVVKEDTATIEEIIQYVRVYPSLVEAGNSLKGFIAQPVDAGLWDAVYLNTVPGESFDSAGFVLRKDNCVMHLDYREKLYNKDPLTGEFRYSQLQLFNQEKAKWAEDLLLNLAQTIAIRQYMKIDQR
jgi:hypothetical protein